MTQASPTMTPAAAGAGTAAADHEPRGLDAAAFAHPYDRSATAALHRVRGFDRAVAKLLEWQHETGAHVALTASSIRVTKRQLPAVHELLVESCRALDMEEPELYVQPGPVNAYTSGHNRPYIVLCSDLVDAMSDQELRAVIAHELGHIKCSHVLYKEMARWLVELGTESVRSAGRNGFAALGAQLVLPYVRRALNDWDQRSELSADRAAMLVVQDEDVCIRMLLKLAGAPVRFGDGLDAGAFLEQAQRLDDLAGDSRKAQRHRQRIRDASTHPLPAERARQLHRWIEEGEYDKTRTALRP